MFIGLSVSAVLYWLLTRSIDVDAEARLAEAETAALEAASHTGSRDLPAAPPHAAGADPMTTTRARSGGESGT